MKTSPRFALAALALLLAGCMSKAPSRAKMAGPATGLSAAQAQSLSAPVQPGRLLTWRADLSLEVADVSNAVAQVIGFVMRLKGKVTSARTERRK